MKKLWLKNIDPNNGISARNGILMAGNCGEELRCWAFLKTRAAMKDVIPRAKILMVTPAMI